MAQKELGWPLTGSVSSPGLSVGITILVLTKLSDLVTTFLGLVVVEGLAEKNPVGAWVYRELGIAGLAGTSFFGILLVIVVVESAGTWLSTLDECSVDRRHLYLISYLPLSAVYALATIHNSILLLQQIS